VSYAQYEAGEVEKTTVVALPPSEAVVVTRFQRTRTRERVTLPANISGAVVYLTAFAALTQTPPTFTVTTPTLTQGEGTPVAQIGPTQPQAPAQQVATTELQIQTYKLLVGTNSTPVSTTITQARRITILADSNNTGVIWISTAFNTPAGVGFPLVAGSAKDFGSPTLEDKYVNPTNLYVVGTAAGDTVEVAVEI
jgi:hypothetical protein